jgi:hypothetical protein
MRRPLCILLLASLSLAFAGRALADPTGHVASRGCGALAVSGKPRTEVVVEIGKLGCPRARGIITFALKHVVPGGAAATLRGPKGWECTFGVFPLKPTQHGAHYDTAHSMSCATPADSPHVRVMIAGFFAS